MSEFYNICYTIYQGTHVHSAVLEMTNKEAGINLAIALRRVKNLTT